MEESGVNCRVKKQGSSSGSSSGGGSRRCITPKFNWKVGRIFTYFLFHWTFQIPNGFLFEAVRYEDC